MTTIKKTLASYAGKKAMQRSRMFDRHSRLATSGLPPVPEIAWSDLQVGQLLGKGAFNNVNALVLKSDKEQNNKYAIKYLRNCIMRRRETFEEAAADLVTESKLLSHLQHEHIISLHGISEGSLTESYKNNRRFFLVLDRLTGTLNDRMHDWRLEEQKLSPIRRMGVSRLIGGLSETQKFRVYNRLRTIAIPVVQGLHYLHSKNIVMRDLKPQNIGFDIYGTVKLFDFGLSREIKDDGRRLTANTGSPLYMAPEVATGKDYGLSADIYSLAYVLYELTSLVTPFEGISPEQHARYILVDNVRPRMDYRCGSFRIQRLITRSWHQNPSRRPEITDVLSILESETARKLGPDWKEGRTISRACRGYAEMFLPSARAA